MSNEVRYIAYAPAPKNISSEPAESPRLIKSANFSLGKLLKLYRERAVPRLTREKLAARLGVSQKTILNWEDDINLPTSHHLKKLLEIFARLELFTRGQEISEASQIWNKRQNQDERNTFGEFDEAWFTAQIEYNQALKPEAVLPIESPNQPPLAQPKSQPQPQNLPFNLSSFVGRAKELAQLTHLLQNPAVRVLSLTGIGGVGKTRLVSQLAVTMADKFKDGICFVSLAGVTEEVFLPSLIGEALNIKETSQSEPPLMQLQQFLANKQLLLVLDNFEQLVGVRSLIPDLLAHAPQLKIIVTSRVVLGLSGEQEFELFPLELPDPYTYQTWEELTEYSAVRLFVERAQLVKPDFELNAENAATITQICRRLDGLPLALELAAALLKLFSPSALLKKLAGTAHSKAINLLVNGTADLPDRQQTLRRTLEWSYALLTAPEQRLFDCLGIFRGGASLEAIAVIWRETEAEIEIGSSENISELLPLLHRLVNKSLIRPQVGSDDDPRFQMLEVVREFARERLEKSGAYDKINRRHIAYFLQLGEQWRSAQAQPLKLDSDHDNLRAAICHCLENGLVETGLRLGTILAPYWQMRGHLSEGRQWLSQGLAISGPVSPLVRAEALRALGTLANLQADYAIAAQAFEESLDLQTNFGSTLDAVDA